MGARTDALSKHLELLRSEKSSLIRQLQELQADSVRTQEEAEASVRRCQAAENSADAIAKVNFQCSHQTLCCCSLRR